MIFHCCYHGIFPLVMILSMINVNLVQPNSFDHGCSDYCSKGGVCLRSADGPKCICLPEWIGDRCGIPQVSSLIKTLRASQGGKINTRDDLCSFVPPDFCNNRGACFVDTSSGSDEFACKCNYPYEGESCEEISECYNFCINNGICKIDTTTKAPTCGCPPEWTGFRCQKPVTTTSTIPPTTTNALCEGVGLTYCKNGGTCILLNNQIGCQCPLTHTGNRCQTPVGGTPSTSSGPPIITLSPTASPFPPIVTLSPTASPFPPIITLSPTVPPAGIRCANQPCRNGATCYNTGTTYFCDCAPRYIGTNCDNLSG